MIMKKIAKLEKRNDEMFEALKCILVFLVIVSVLFSIVLITENPLVFFSSLMLMGYLSWTFTEYFMHRFWMHSRFRKLNTVPYHMHMEHHRHPTEIKISGNQRALALFGSVFLTSIAFYFNNYFTVFVGFVNGFLIYSTIHYILHQRWAKYIFPNVQKNHIHHHGKYPDKGFSFSTTLWDWLFDTLPPKEAKISKHMELFFFGHHKEHSSGQI